MRVSRGLSYSDAVRLLGGTDSKIVTALDKLSGGILLGAAINVPALLGLFEARAELARLSQDLVRAFAEHRRGLSRYDRTQRLLAAHGVVVVTAFFEALSAADLPFRFGELELTRAEQVSVASGGSALAADMASLVDGLMTLTRDTLPEPQEPYENLLESLQKQYYPQLSTAIARFIAGLAIWDRLSETDKNRFSQVLQSVPVVARHRYEELFRMLAADFPEVACWASLREHQATRSEIRELGVALAELERLLNEISTGRDPGEIRTALARAYRAELERPIAETGNVQGGLQVPVLGQAYVPARFRVRELVARESPGDESWWEQVPVRDDLEEFLVGHLTSPQATRAPLLVLGQPGSGKSVLTRVLAARLPAADFLPVRVVLREVQAAASVQDQLEQAIRAATGERQDWPALARSAGDALPVILLDGFDELLQATGVSQSDYLAKVADFQRREGDQDRPAAVIVTSRTSVANRARPPEESVALRLEPFDAVRITAWLDIWNSANATQFAARGLLPLSSEAVLAHRELAEQPLLLLMLALYDADGNNLQHIPAELRQGELYERLLRSFASREIVKHRPGTPDRELTEAVEDELRRLSIVAFAMFNRSSQWVTEADLNDDLNALVGPQQARVGQDMNAPLLAAEIMLGRFFFVYRSQARRDESRLQTYEFLHATFGEFLIARLAAQVLGDIAARDAASTMFLGSSAPEDDLLHALLSFAVLSVRSSIVGFLTEIMERLTPPDRQAHTKLLIRLFRLADQPRPGRHFDSYRPKPLPVTARYAAYSANLTLLAVCAADSIWASDLFGSNPYTVDEWHRKALLWRSQLDTEEWTSLVESITVNRVWDDEMRDVELTLGEREAPVPVIDLQWTYNDKPERDQLMIAFQNTSQEPEMLRRKVHFMCAINDDVITHALEPALTTLEPIVNLFAGFREVMCSAANALLAVLLAPLKEQEAEEREAAYRRCASIAVDIIPALSDDENLSEEYAALLLDRLAVDNSVSPAFAADILDMFTSRTPSQFSDRLAAGIVRCSLVFLGKDGESDGRIAEGLFYVLMPDLSMLDADLGLEAWIRLIELGRPSLPLHILDEPEVFYRLVQSVTSGRPDLAERAQRIVEELNLIPPGDRLDISTWTGEAQNR